MDLPDNVAFLPGAAEEFLGLRRRNRKLYRSILASLISLGRDGPPEGTCYVPVQEPPFPNTLAYRYEVAGFAVVFECNHRVVMKTTSGVTVVRALRAHGSDSRYTVWAILRPSA